MLAQWRLARAGIANATIQCNQQLWLVHFQTALAAVAICGWEFIAESTSSSTFWRPIMLALPQFMLLAIVVVQFFPVLKLRIRRLIQVASVALLPAICVAVIHSGFRMGIGLCCCSSAFCPIPTIVDGALDSASCSLVLKNCYMAFIRKIVHFYGTASLLTPHGYNYLRDGTYTADVRTPALRGFPDQDAYSVVTRPTDSEVNVSIVEISEQSLMQNHNQQQ